MESTKIDLNRLSDVKKKRTLYKVIYDIIRKNIYSHT